MLFNNTPFWKSALVVLCLLGSVHAQAEGKKKPKPKAVNVPYCIENVCLGDPVSKFQSALGSLYDNYPACSYKAYTVTMYGPQGYPMGVTFYPYADAKGAHYRVGRISEAMADDISLEKARRIFDSKRVGKFEEVPPSPFTFSAKFRESSKEDGDVGYYLNLMWQEGGVHVVYTTEQLRNQSALTGQPGCSLADAN